MRNPNPDIPEDGDDSFRVLRGSKEVAAKVAAALHLMVDRGRGAAEAALRILLLKHPEEPSVHVALAGVLLAQGRFRETADAYAGAARLLPEETEVLLSLAHARLGAHQVEEALAAVREFRRRRPGDARGGVLEGRILCFAGRVDESERTLKAALAAGGEEEEAYQALAILYAEQGRFAESVVCLEELDRLRPEDPVVRMLLARVAGEAGDAGAALAHAEEALRRSRGSPAAAASMVAFLQPVRGRAKGPGRRRRPPKSDSSTVPTPDPAAPEGTKVSWSGEVLAVQPRIHLGRAFDTRHHVYRGYRLLVRGRVEEGEEREFRVAVGGSAHARHSFRAGDRVSGTAWGAKPGKSQVVDLLRSGSFRFEARGPESVAGGPPFLGVPPPLEEYRRRGHLRLSARTYAARCTRCRFGAEMSVEIVIDLGKGGPVRHRRETFCYGPKSCPLYSPGPQRSTPGSGGTSYTEGDWIDEETTWGRGPEEPGS